MAFGCFASLKQAQRFLLLTTYIILNYIANSIIDNIIFQILSITLSVPVSLDINSLSCKRNIVLSFLMKQDSKSKADRAVPVRVPGREVAVSAGQASGRPVVQVAAAPGAPDATRAARRIEGGAARHYIAPIKNQLILK